MDRLEVIKKAINVEIKNKYINIRGKKQYFADFIISYIRGQIRTSSIAERWKTVLEYFKIYSTSTYIERKRYVDFFIETIKQETNNKKA